MEKVVGEKNFVTSGEFLNPPTPTSLFIGEKNNNSKNYGPETIQYRETM